MKLRTSASAICCLAALGALAQSHPAKAVTGEVRSIFEQIENGDTVYKVFEENAPKAWNSPSVPRFAIIGKNQKFYLGVGGYVKGTMSYDIGDPIDNAFDFTTSQIPMDPAPGNKALIQFSGATSSVFLNFVALPGTDNAIGAFIDFNFTGNGYTPSLQYAYLNYRGITMGYNYGVFCDMAAAPPTIDNEGPCGFVAIPNGVLDYQRSFAKNWKFGVGLEMPIASYTTYYNEDGGQVNQRVPDIPAYIQYSWGGGSSWLRFSAILRNITYRNIRTEKNHNVTGWGVKLSGSAAIVPNLRAYYQAAYGVGIASYFQDIYGGGLDLTPVNDYQSGELKPSKAYGAYAGLQYNFSPSVFCSATYSITHTFIKDYSSAANGWDGQYRQAQYVAANVFWNIKSYLQWGVEYLYGQRKDQNGLTHSDNRIQTMLQLNF